MPEASLGGLAGGCRCERTGFSGLEPLILALRNTNRDIPETLEYLCWRYRSATDMPPPRIYWLLSPQAARIGMAAVIFRPYWVDGHRQPVAVVGDISVDVRWRGQALGAGLLGCMTRDLDAQLGGTPALVIPTESARRALARNGWIDAGRLQDWVCVLDGARFLRPYLGSGPARSLAAAWRAGSGRWLRRFIPADARLEFESVAATTLHGLPVQPAPAGVVRRELSADSLEWRYQAHPHSAFRFVTLSLGRDKVALLVFERDSMPDSAVIYDVHATGSRERRALLASFIQWAHRQPDLTSVRMQLDAAHPLGADLRVLGFLRRAGKAVYQLHAAERRLVALQWQLTQGDKDT